MGEVLYAMLVLYGVISLAGSIFLLSYFFDGKSFGSPKYIYGNSTMNIFGVILSVIILFILFPLYYIILFIYWICHI